MKTDIVSLLIMVSLSISTLAIETEANGMEQQHPLNQRQQSIILIAAFTANGEIDRLEPALHQGLDAGLTINEIKEVLVQMYAYAGFPRSLNGLGAFMSILEERRAKGIKDETGKAAGPMPTDKSSLEFGTENQTKLVGQPVKGPLFDFAPTIDQFLKAHLFGDIFQRDVLTWQERELATIAALASTKGVNSQLQAHYGISMNNGITPEQLHGFVAVLKTECGPEVARNAGDVLEQVLNAAGK
ncbi:MAG: carboxymuconolactone decarboxylase family protein [Thermodesulfobacteriota bacterium]|nr:carboxymuconolactone decarboxylase family protein [Thermodesulfobacteriota bacterium]